MFEEFCNALSKDILVKIWNFEETEFNCDSNFEALQFNPKYWGFTVQMVGVLQHFKITVLKGCWEALILDNLKKLWTDKPIKSLGRFA